MLSSTELRSRLANRASELGLCGFGVSAAQTPPDDRDRLFQWLTRGYQASMTWMARNAQRRADLQQVLPGAKSVISVTLNYYHPDTHNESCGELKVSRYAWGDDYHDILGARIGQLKDYIEELAPGSRSLTYVDTGPIMEKALAQSAGLGWIGKNACLITRDYGSWVFLGEIVTTAELPVDQPHTDFCGSCTRCMDACPTDAFSEPYVLDATRCISYWTIEHRGDDIPEELSAHFDGWIFGCDICQDVCPWNSFARVSDEPRLAPAGGHLNPPADKWLAMTDEEFRTAFARFPILRTGPNGLKRNIQSQRRDILLNAVRTVRADAAPAV